MYIKTRAGLHTKHWKNSLSLIMLLKSEETGAWSWFYPILFVPDGALLLMHWLNQHWFMSWIHNSTKQKLWDVITHIYPNFRGGLDNYIWQVHVDVITYPCANYIWAISLFKIELPNVSLGHPVRWKAHRPCFKKFLSVRHSHVAFLRIEVWTDWSKFYCDLTFVQVKWVIVSLI